MPLSARFPRGSIQREDRLPVPADALREVILNAVIHRDFSRASSYVAIAVFDDRIEVRSVDDFPSGIRAELLSKEHPSILRNPLIAGAFHRTGAVEVWGRGTNRVIEACRVYGIKPPEFGEEAGVVTVTFKAAVLDEISIVSQSLPGLMAPSGRTDRTKFRDQVLRPLLDEGLLEMTIPDKPRSSKQQYRTTAAGRERLHRKS